MTQAHSSGGGRSTPPHVLDIANSDQCSYCGICLGVCPGLGEHKNLFVQSLGDDGWELAVKNEDICTGCTLCRDACPMNKIDYAALEAATFGTETGLREHPLVGFYRNCYVGYSTDATRRFDGASGGVMTDMLAWLFETDQIDGALIVVPGSGGPNDYRGVIVDRADDLAQGTGSHYLPIPAAAAMDQIIYGPYRRVAAVGIPCQVNGVRLASERIAKLKRRVVLTMGSFCGYTSHFRMSEFIRSRVPTEQRDGLRRIAYRKGLWPGNIETGFDDGSTGTVSGELRDFMAFNAILPACLYCADQFNELADISFGDAWLPEYMGRHDGGYSTIVTRSDAGQRVLDAMIDAGRMSLVKHTAEDIFTSQRGPVDYKKRGLGARLFLRRFFTANTPRIANARLMPWGPMDIVAAAALLVQIRLSRRAWYWRFLLTQSDGAIVALLKPMYVFQKRYNLTRRIWRKFLRTLRLSTTS